MSIKNIIFFILIPLTLILLAAAIFLTLKQRAKHVRKNKLIEISKAVNVNRVTMADAILTRVSKIVNSNKAISEEYNELEKYHSQITQITKSLIALEEDLAANFLKISKSEFNAIYSDALIKIEKLQIAEKRFKKISIQFTHQDTFLTSEYVFYSGHLRSAIEIYKKKRIQLNRVSSQIDDLSKKISLLGQKFQSELNAANNKEASRTLNIYAKMVQRFIYIISVAPQIETYIYITIPKIINDLTKVYKDKKNEIKASLSHINFRVFLTEVAKLFNNAKVDFKSLNVESAIEKIKNILRNIKFIEKMINFEILTRNFFINNYERVIKISKKTLSNYVSLKINEIVKKIVSKGVTISPELTSSINSTKTIAKELDQYALSFRDSMRDKTIPYSSKLSRMKILLQKNSNLIFHMNETIQQVWTQDVETSIVKNKFRKSETAINEILANMKKVNMKMQDLQKSNYLSISKEIDELSKYIEKELINKDVQQKVANLMKDVSIFYTSVIGDIIIAEMVSNMLKEMAPERAIDPKLNITMSNAEREYLEGKYDSSLNIIIRELEERER